MVCVCRLVYVLSLIYSLIESPGGAARGLAALGWLAGTYSTALLRSGSVGEQRWLIIVAMACLAKLLVSKSPLAQLSYPSVQASLETSCHRPGAPSDACDRQLRALCLPRAK